MICPLSFKDLMALINCHLQKELKKRKGDESSLIKNISYGESLFQSYAFKNSTENLQTIIRFCVEYQISISKITDPQKRLIKDIAISIAEALFDLKFDFNLVNLLLLTKHLVDNELNTDTPQENNNILNIKQAARELSLSVQTLRNRAKRGEIPVFGKSVKGYRFEKTALLEWGRNYRSK
jgi:Helix-turn-helix domain